MPGPTLQPVEDEDTCGSSLNSQGFFYSVARIMKNRLKVLMSGGNPSGFYFGSPSHQLFNAGIVEALLYTWRALDIAFALRRTESVEEVEVALLSLHDNIRTLYQEVFHALKINDNEYIIRSLYDWIDITDALIHAIEEAYNPPGGEWCMTMGPDVEDVVASLISKGITPEDLGYIKFSPGYDTSKVVLNNGVVMPTVGLGVWQLEGENCVNAVKDALLLGYSLLDGAQAYANDLQVGQAITAVSDQIPRKDVFILNKISNPDAMGAVQTKNLVQRQLEALNTSYIDLYMMHGFMGTLEQRRETWKALEELVDENRIRALGVSNYGEGELLELLGFARIPPAVVENK